MGVCVVLGCCSHPKGPRELLELLCMSHRCSAWPCLPSACPHFLSSPCPCPYLTPTFPLPRELVKHSAHPPPSPQVFPALVLFFYPPTKASAPRHLLPSHSHLGKAKKPNKPTPAPRSQLLLFVLKSLPSCLAGLKACTLEGASQLSLATLLQTDRHR